MTNFDDRSTLLLSIVPLALLAGCGTMQHYPELEGSLADTGAVVTDEAPAPGDDDDDDDDDDAVASSIDVDSVQPSYGLDMGGDEVTIFGGPFSDDVEVWFGDAEAEVLEIEDDRLEVATPSFDEGRVDVRVVSADGEGSLSEGFRFWADATGKAGLAGTVAIVDVVGDYWGPNTNDFAYAEIAAIEPTNYATWEQYAPNQNACSSNYEPPALDLLDASGGSLVSATTEVDLDNDDGWLEADTDIAPGETVDFIADQSEGIESMTLDELVRVPEAFQVTRPNLDSADPIPAPRQFDLQWNAANPGDYVAIVMEKVDVAADGSYTVKQTVSCAVPDTGLYTVPGSLWDDWLTGDRVLVRIGRIRESSLTLPHNNADVAVTGAYWVTGALSVE